MYGKEEILELLEKKHIAYELHEHPAALTVEDILSYHLPHPEYGAKNLFLRDDKKRNYYLLTVRDDLQTDLSSFREKAGTRRLSFASEDDLMKYLHLQKGSVTPFGILNDAENKVIVYIDAYFRNTKITVHPNVNTASATLETEDLADLLREHGSTVYYIEL